MPEHEVTTGEIMEFLKEHMVTKSELVSLEKKVDDLAVRVISLEENQKEFATKDDLIAFKSEILDAIDAGTKKQDVLETEMVATRGRQDRMEDRLVVVERATGVA